MGEIEDFADEFTPEPHRDKVFRGASSECQFAIFPQTHCGAIAVKTIDGQRLCKFHARIRERR